MNHDYALPKFESPESKRRKVIKWALIGGGGLVVIQLLVVAAVAINRNNEAKEQIARMEAEKQATEQRRLEAARVLAEAAAVQRPVVPVANVAADEALPPRAEEEKPIANKSEKSRSSRKARRDRRSSSRSVAARGSDSKAADSGQKRMQASEIDKLLSQFR